MSLRHLPFLQQMKGGSLYISLSKLIDSLFLHLSKAGNRPNAGLSVLWPQLTTPCTANNNLCDFYRTQNNLVNNCKAQLKACDKKLIFERIVSVYGDSNVRLVTQYPILIL